jgi:transcriptional regulator with XRE-family HTH domain
LSASFGRTNLGAMEGLNIRVESLRRWFKETGVTQERLAVLVQVKQSTMSQIVNRRMLPSLKVYRRMVRETGLAPMDLLDDLLGEPPRIDTRRAMPTNVTNLQVARLKRRNGSTGN